MATTEWGEEARARRGVHAAIRYGWECADAKREEGMGDVDWV